MTEKYALIDYLVEFHASRDFFECHEIMEEYWKSKENEDYAQFWLALIQLAVGQYHDRRTNVKGAKRMYESALAKFQDDIGRVQFIDVQALCEQLKNRLHNMDKPFYDFNIKIVDNQLEKACLQLAKSRQLVWGISSENISEEIVHRHITRDRTNVIAERQASLERKRNSRSTIKRNTSQENI